MYLSEGETMFETETMDQAIAVMFRYKNEIEQHRVTLDSAAEAFETALQDDLAPQMAATLRSASARLIGSADYIDQIIRKMENESQTILEASEWQE